MRLFTRIRSVLWKATEWEQRPIREEPALFDELDAVCQEISESGKGGDDKTIADLTQLDSALLRELSPHAGFMSKAVAQIVALHIRHALLPASCESYEKLVYDSRRPAIEAVCSGILEPLLEADMTTFPMETVRRYLVWRQQRLSAEKMSVFWLFKAVARGFARLYPEFTRQSCEPLDQLTSGEISDISMADAAEILLYLTIRYETIGAEEYDQFLRDEKTPEGQFRYRCCELWQRAQWPGLTVLTAMRLCLDNGDDLWPEVKFLSTSQQRLMRSSLLLIILALFVLWTIWRYVAAGNEVRGAF
jgi:hypothetical protein